MPKKKPAKKKVPKKPERTYKDVIHELLEESDISKVLAVGIWNNGNCDKVGILALSPKDLRLLVESAGIVYPEKTHAEFIARYIVYRQYYLNLDDPERAEKQTVNMNKYMSSRGITYLPVQEEKKNGQKRHSNEKDLVRSKRN
jgi:hypothetical protein